ncbi:MAG: GAF domain-containing protein [Gemmatimonadota bacterium]|nr:GAF domain-containing protein [Gemmatimonadota bacterium]
MTRLAVKFLGVPVAFMSLVDADRDFYKSATGFGEPLQSDRQLTGRTFCHYAIQSSAPLIVEDAEAHPIYRSIPTVKTLGVRAYLGIPLVMTTVRPSAPSARSTPSRGDGPRQR